MSSVDDLISNTVARSAQNMGDIEARRQQWESVLGRAADYRSKQTGIPRERQEREFWEKILDVVQTGNYASAGIALAIKRGDPDVWQSIVQGVKNRTTYSDVLKEYGVEGGLGIGLGLIGDIFLDPTTYIPGFGLTAKGKAVQRVVGHLSDMRKTGVVTDRASEIEAIRKMVTALPTGKEKRLLEEAVGDGFKAFQARTFSEQVATGLRRPFVIERPSGLMKLPIPRTKVRVPLPLPKFETTGLAVPLPKTVEVGMARGVESLGALAAKTPGIKRLKKYMGDKFFGSYVRSEFSNPTIQGMFGDLYNAYQHQLQGRTNRFHEILESIGRVERPTKEMLRGIAVAEDSDIGELLHHVFKEAYHKGYGKEERRILGIMIEEPERILGKADQNVAEMIFRDIFISEPTDRYFRAVTFGKTEDIAHLLDTTKDIQGLQAAERKLQRGIIYAERALVPYRQGLRSLEEPDYTLIQKQLQNFEAGLETVRGRLAQLQPPKPVKEFGPTAMLDMPPPKAPIVDPGALTRSYGSAAQATALREAKYAQLVDLVNRRDRVFQYGTTPGRSAGLTQNARFVHQRLTEAWNRARVELAAIDMEMIRAERAVQERKRLGIETERAIGEEIKKISQQPSMRQPAVQVLPDVQRELADLDRQLEMAEQAGDQARAGELIDRIQDLQKESVGSRAARLARERELSPLEHRAMALEFAHQARIKTYEALKAEAPEVGILRAMGPEPLAQRVEHVARTMGLDLREAQRLAATTSPLEFQQRLQARVESLSPQEINQIGHEVVESAGSAEVAEVHRLLRESAGLAPASIQLQLADLGLREPEVMAHLQAQTGKLLDRLRSMDPTSNIDLDSVHIIGDWARGEGQIGKPIQAVAFVDSPLDESDLAMALSQPIDLPGGVIPQQVEVMPWKLAGDQTKADVLRALGAERRAPFSEAQQELKLVDQALDPEAAKALAAVSAKAPAQRSLSEQPLVELGERADRVIAQARELRAHRASLAGVDRRLNNDLRRRIAKVRNDLDRWEKTWGTNVPGYEQAMHDAIRYRLNRYDPEMLTAETMDLRRRLREYRPRAFKGLRIKTPAPWKGGNPTVNTAVWADEAKPFLGLNRGNALDILEANPNIRPKEWIEYAPNGAPTGQKISDEEFLKGLRAMNAGKASTIRLGPEGITLDRAFEDARVFPETHTVEFVDSAGNIYQGNLSIPLDVTRFPKNVALATGPVTLHLPDGKKHDFADMEKLRRWFLAKYSGEAGIKARLGEEALDPEKQVKIRLGVEKFLSGFRVSRHGGTRNWVPEPGDMGLDFGPGGYYPTVVGSYKPWGNFRTGEFVNIQGKPAQVIAEPSENIRRVQTVDGQVLDVHAQQLKLGTLKEIARNEQSILDFLLMAGQRADGSIDQARVKEMLKGLERDHLMKSELADLLTEDLIKNTPMTPELLMGKRALKAILEGLLQDEHSVGLLTRKLLFYLPRKALDHLEERKIKNFGSMPKIVMEQPWFTRHRETVDKTISQMNDALKAQGVDPRWLEDPMIATGMRGRASIRMTETARFMQAVMRTFAKPLNEKGVAAMASGYEKLLRDVYNLPEEHIQGIVSRVERLIELEGKTKGGATEIGMGVRRMSPDQQAKHLEEIQRLRADLNEMAPPFGIFVPKGALQRYATKLASEPIEEIGEEASKAIALLTENGAMYEGSQFLQIPIDKLFAVKHLPKDVPVALMPREVADAVNGALSNFASMGEDLNQVLRVFDVIQNYWKSWTLGIFPAYHFRNLVGNIWNSFLAGAHDPERWEEGGRFFSGNLHDFKDQYGNHIPYKQLEEEVIDNNMLNRGEYTVDLQYGPEGMTREVSLKPIPLKGMLDALRGKAPKQQIALAIGQRIGKRNEDWAKVALYLDGRYKGMSPTAAAQRVRKYLFDYDALGTVERAIMPRLFPFYRWSRFNIPLQLQSFLTRPAKFTGVKKGIDAIKEYVGEPPEERYLPEWMKGQVPVPVKDFGNGKYGYWLLGNWLPAADLVRMTDPAAMAGGMLTPVAKAPFEYAANWSLFFQNQIERFPKETGQFLGLQLRQRDINLFRNVRLLNELDKIAFKKDLPAPIRVARSVAGRVYPVDFVEQAQFKAYELGREKSAITTSIRRAQKELHEANQEGDAIRAYQLKRHIAALQHDLRGVVDEQERLRVSLPKKTASERRRERLERKAIEMESGVR